MSKKIEPKDPMDGERDGGLLRRIWRAVKRRTGFRMYSDRDLKQDVVAVDWR